MVLRKHKVVVLSDEIYGSICWHEFQPLMKVLPNQKFLEEAPKKDFFFQFYPEGTITTNGFSKSFSAGGWRIGFAIVPDELQEIRNAMKAAGTHTFSCAPAPMQHACAEVFTDSTTIFPGLMTSRLWKPSFAGFKASN